MNNSVNNKLIENSLCINFKKIIISFIKVRFFGVWILKIEVMFF